MMSFLRWIQWVALRMNVVCILAVFLFSGLATADVLLVPMDDTQRDHLKAYGLTYWALDAPQGYGAEWLLNYRGGSFVIKETVRTARKAKLLGITTQVISRAQLEAIHDQISRENMEVVQLEKAPRVAVYAPPDSDPWGDAVVVALTYADIPFDQIYDPEVLSGRLFQYDWVHLHHEDFTGQFGKFYGNFRNAPWYQMKVRRFQQAARNAGFSSVAEHKLAVAKTLKDYIQQGGFLFAMCSATETFDIALAAEGINIIPAEIDGTPMTPGFQSKLDFGKTLAFQNFRLSSDAYEYRHSDIDILPPTSIVPTDEYFSLFEFSAKIDTIPTMLVQCHTARVKEFLGQTTAFQRSRIKDTVIVLGERPGGNVVKYLHGNYGDGFFTFYAGHDPEDYAHLVGEAPTELSLHKNSPGYRLILNNILFPAAKQRERRT